MTSSNERSELTDFFRADASISRVIDSMNLLFGESEVVVMGRKLCADARQEIAQYKTARSSSIRMVAVIGAGKSGKSWFCRQFVIDPVERDRIPSGEGFNTSNSKPLIIGAPTGAPLREEINDYMFLKKNQMVDLGTSYILVDFPAFNRGNGHNSDPGALSMSGIDCRVLMLSAETLGNEAQLEFLRVSDGSKILPVIVDHAYPEFRENGADDLARLVERIKNRCPFAEIAPPIIVPHFGYYAGDEKMRLVVESNVTEQLRNALRKFIGTPVVSNDVILQAVIRRLRFQLAALLVEFRKSVEPAYEGLLRAELDLAQKIGTEILGTDGQLRSVLRTKLHFRAHSEASDLWFPFKGFLGIMALTTGAWSRLALATVGSLPSLALVIFSGFRNFRQADSHRKDAIAALRGIVEGMVQQGVAGPDRTFISAIDSVVPSGSRNEDASMSSRLEGLDLLVAESDRLVGEMVGSIDIKAKLSVFGVLATFIFLSLLAGPLFAIYSAFGRAWFGALSVENAVTWESFPAPTFGMLSMSAVLILLPVAILAMLTCVAVARQGTVDSLASRLRDSHKVKVAELCHSRVLRLVSESRAREAVRDLLDFIREGRS
jgi:hypothetical protein